MSWIRAYETRLTMDHVRPHTHAPAIEDMQ